MKKILFGTLALSILLFSISCRKAKKDFNDYLPVTKILSATVQTDGSVVVQGELESIGEAKTNYIGFCCSTNSTPVLGNKQIICQLNDNKFTATFLQLSSDSAYYFRAWATNKFGYSYSNIIKLDSIVAPHVTAPCTQVNETVATGTTFGHGSYYGAHPCLWSSTYSEYIITGNTSVGVDVNIYMNAPLSQGLYTTTGYDPPGYREMYVQFLDGSLYVLNPGTKVYVNKIGANLFDVTICDAPWLFSGSTTLLFNTRFTSYN